MGVGDALDVGGREALGVGGGRRGRDDRRRRGGRCRLRGRRGAARQLQHRAGSSTSAGSRPFIAAIALSETPDCAASPESVSPARTV